MMPEISQIKKDKISEQILHYLFIESPQAKFTAEIASEIARDEEFTKSLLQNLRDKNLIAEINKNSSGLKYTRRKRWLLSNHAFEAYTNNQQQQSL